MPWLLPLLLAVSPALWAPMGVVAAAVVGVGGSYLLGRRSTSGSVETSAASDLWQAQDSLRKDLAAALTAERDERKADQLRFQADLNQERSERHRLEGALAAEVKERQRVEEINRELVATMAAQEVRITSLEARANE